MFFFIYHKVKHSDSTEIKGEKKKNLIELNFTHKNWECSSDFSYFYPMLTTSKSDADIDIEKP